MIRVATYNIHFGGEKRETLIAQVLREINADVVVLTEASKSHVIDNLANSLGMKSVVATGRKTSIAILTRLPIKSWNCFDPPYIGRPLLEATVETPSGHSFTLFGLHLQCHFFKHNEKQRVRELTSYLNYINECNCGEHVILGDFNAIAEGDIPLINRMPLKEKLMLHWEKQHLYHDAISVVQAKGYVDCFRLINPTASGFTLPVHAPNIRLDYIFASITLANNVQKCRVHNTESTLAASDHFPLYAAFDI